MAGGFGVKLRTNTRYDSSDSELLTPDSFNQPRTAIESSAPASVSLPDLGRIFLRLGCTGFGGPAAHIAMMRREFVERRGWIDAERFADLLGAVNLIPGPNSTELAISIGAELQGRRGLLVAGACFIAPAFAIVLLLAWLYTIYGRLPDVAAIFMGVKPVALALVAHALVKLGETMAKRPAMILLAILVFLAAMLGVHELPLLLGSGLVAALIPRRRGPFTTFFSLPAIPAIFLYFLYIGSVLYGSGYVLVAFLTNDLLAMGWITKRQLLDAIAVGQVTPGPLFTTATFIGYLLGGVGGSVAATAGIFLPSFLFVLATHRWIARLRSRPATAAFLDGVNAAALALIASALLSLGAETLRAPFAWTLALAALAALLLTKVNPVWLILAGGVVGWVAGSW